MLCGQTCILKLHCLCCFLPGMPAPPPTHSWEDLCPYRVSDTHTHILRTSLMAFISLSPCWRLGCTLNLDLWESGAAKRWAGEGSSQKPRLTIPQQAQISAFLEDRAEFCLLGEGSLDARMVPGRVCRHRPAQTRWIVSGGGCWREGPERSMWGGWAVIKPSYGKCIHSGVHNTDYLKWTLQGDAPPRSSSPPASLELLGRR